VLACWNNIRLFLHEYANKRTQLVIVAITSSNSIGESLRPKIYMSATIQIKYSGVNEFLTKAYSEPSALLSGGAALSVAIMPRLRPEKELCPIPRFRATAKLGAFLESRLA
jgi:hypothetical protein